MSVDNANIVDLVGVDKESAETVLTISDHLPWDETNEHILMLQEKINRYLAFIESGEIYEKYPDAKGRKCIISVVALYHPTETAERFLQSVNAIVEGAGIGFRFKQKHFNSPP
jgi:hypothetical protein